MLERKVGEDLFFYGKRFCSLQYDSGVCTVRLKRDSPGQFLLLSS